MRSFLALPLAVPAAGPAWAGLLLVAATSPSSSIVLAQGSACAAVIARYRAVVQSDVETGNANKSVGARIERDIAGAEAACTGGRDSEALRLIAASKARHGYPSGL